MLTRRNTLLNLLAAPVIIKTGGLLMPIKPIKPSNVFYFSEYIDYLNESTDYILRHLDNMILFRDNYHKNMFIDAEIFLPLGEYNANT